MVTHLLTCVAINITWLASTCFSTQRQSRSCGLSIEFLQCQLLRSGGAIRQLWGQRKNCAVAQPGGQAVGACCCRVGGIWRGMVGRGAPQFGSSARQAGFRRVGDSCAGRETEKLRGYQLRNSTRHVHANTVFRVAALKQMQNLNLPISASTTKRYVEPKAL